MEKNNIIQFPGTHKIHPPQNEDELRASVEKVKAQFVTDTAVEIAFEVFRDMERAGCDINSTATSREDLILVSESIKSAMYRSLGMKHPLQKFAAQVIEVSNTDTDFLMPSSDDEK